MAVIGMGTALAVSPDLPDRWRAGREADQRMRPVTWSDKALASVATMAQVRHQMHRLARGRDPKPGTHPAVALVADQPKQRRALQRYRAWLSASSPSPSSASWARAACLTTGGGPGWRTPRPPPVPVGSEVQ
ncbi:hypothetical protein [Kitasatospora acidiphila]|uniref:hypothetical protein n=1 Tax=Kitasatospora acidiphila TaxID=2567942 RepID=UPI001E62AB4C|nr:hypothetical protein [Kitasatospora acidiphila]